jgi:hypothetical protein
MTMKKWTNAMQQASLGFWKQMSKGGSQKWSLHMQTTPENLDNKTCTKCFMTYF